MVSFAKKYKIKFIRKEKITKEIYSFYFTPTGDQQVNWIPGQYFHLLIPHNADERGTSRFFTIASAPTEKEIMLTIKEGESSFKKNIIQFNSRYNSQCIWADGEIYS